MKLFLLTFLFSISVFGQTPVKKFQDYVKTSDTDVLRASTVSPGSLVPAGAVMAFARTSCPTGWLEANGSQVSRSTYSALFASIGTAYGAGDGSTTFNLPRPFWFVDAAIQGANIGLSVTGTYTPLEHGSLSLSATPDSINTWIACAGTGTPSGGTCTSSNESLGIVFTVPYGGVANVCASFSQQMTNSSNNSQLNSFRLAQTAVNSQAVIVYGNNRIANYHKADDAANTASAGVATTICSTFVLSPGQTAIRLLYTASGGWAENFIRADGSGGSLAANFTVYPLASVADKSCIKY